MSATRVQTDPRISRRRKAVSRSKRKRFLVGTIGIALLTAAVGTMFWSPVFLVDEVQVAGAEHVSTAEVIEAAGVMGTEQNLLLLPTQEVTERVRALPWVEDAIVERMLPGTVRVRIVEREPAMTLSIGAAYWTIDVDGYVVSDGRIDDGLPVLSELEVGSVEPGVRLQTQEARDALAAYAALPRGIRKRVAGVSAPSPERISFTLDDGMELRIGSGRQMQAKAEVLKALLARLRAEGTTAAYLDVRVPTSPAIGGGAAPVTEE